MSKKKENELSFEDLIKATEAAVEELESGELSLEAAMSQYELGVKNLKLCSSIITEAQKKVEQLIADADGKISLTPLPANIEEE